MTCEEHSIIGGLGSAVAEVLAEAGTACKLVRVGVQDVFGEVENQLNYSQNTRLMRMLL